MMNSYITPTPNIILNDEKLDPFFPKTGIKERMSSLLFIIVCTENLASAVRQKEIKGTLFGKEEIKLSLFAMM